MFTAEEAKNAYDTSLAMQECETLMKDYILPKIGNMIKDEAYKANKCVEVFIRINKDSKRVEVGGIEEQKFNRLFFNKQTTECIPSYMLTYLCDKLRTEGKYEVEVFYCGCGSFLDDNEYGGGYYSGRIGNVLLIKW